MTAPPLKDNSAQPLIKTLKIFLDANLSQATTEAKKINGHVEQIPSIPDILKMIVERKEDIIREESPELIKDIHALFASIAKLKDSSYSASLIDFKLLDSLYIIAHNVGELRLSNWDSTYKIHILSYCSEMSTFYRNNNGEKGNDFVRKQFDLSKNIVKYIP